MTNFSEMLSKAKEMQEKMKQVQDNLKKIEVEGVSGGNLVKVILTGDYEIKSITIIQQDEFIFSALTDGLSKGRVIRPVQTNFGVSICGSNFIQNSNDINERKFQKALQIVERIAAMGVTNSEELPYYKIN